MNRWDMLLVKSKRKIDNIFYVSILTLYIFMLVSCIQNDSNLTNEVSVLSVKSKQINNFKNSNITDADINFIKESSYLYFDTIGYKQDHSILNNYITEENAYVFDTICNLVIYCFQEIPFGALDSYFGTIIYIKNMEKNGKKKLIMNTYMNPNIDTQYLGNPKIIDDLFSDCKDTISINKLKVLSIQGYYPKFPIKYFLRLKDVNIINDNYGLSLYEKYVTKDYSDIKKLIDIPNYNDYSESDLIKFGGYENCKEEFLKYDSLYYYNWGFQIDINRKYFLENLSKVKELSNSKEYILFYRVPELFLYKLNINTGIIDYV